MADPLERRVNLLALLLETSEPLTFEQIGHELAGQYPESPSARRGAFERDKFELRRLGVPIEQRVLEGEHGGATAYWVNRDAYELADLGLTDEEREAIQLAVATVRLGGDAGGLALLKLGGDTAEEAGPLLAALPSSSSLPTLFEANATRIPVRFPYRGRVRTVDPYGLLTRDGFWYVVGYEHESGRRKTFRVDRIDGEAVLDTGAEAFVAPADFDPVAAVFTDPKRLAEEGAEPVDALVAVDSLRAASVVREVGAESVVERRADGGVVVKVPATNRAAFRSWVLGLLDHAEVVAPPEVRAELVEWLDQVAERSG